LQPAAAIRSRGPDPNKIADFYAVFHAHAHPRGERAATAQQLTGTTGSNRAVTVNLQRQHRKRTETASQTRRNRAATGAIYSRSYLYVSRPNIQPHTCTYALT
jgi:hypothetical protein